MFSEIDKRMILNQITRQTIVYLLGGTRNYNNYTIKLIATVVGFLTYNNVIKKIFYLNTNNKILNETININFKFFTMFIIKGLLLNKLHDIEYLRMVGFSLVGFSVFTLIIHHLLNITDKNKQQILFLTKDIVSSYLENMDTLEKHELTINKDDLIGILVYYSIVEKIFFKNK